MNSSNVIFLVLLAILSKRCYKEVATGKNIVSQSQRRKNLSGTMINVASAAGRLSKMKTEN